MNRIIFTVSLVLSVIGFVIGKVLVDHGSLTKASAPLLMGMLCGMMSPVCFYICGRQARNERIHFVALKLCGQCLVAVFMIWLLLST